MPTSPTELRRASQLIAADYTREAQIVWNAADHIDRLTSELAQLSLELDRTRRSATLWSMAATARADSPKHPNDIGARGPTYCPHCGVPPAEHSNGVCPKFPRYNAISMARLTGNRCQWDDKGNRYFVTDQDLAKEPLA